MAIASFIVSIIMAILSIFGIGGGNSSGGNNGGGSTPVNTTPTGYDISVDVEYGSDAQQKFDLMIPQGIGSRLSIAIFIHGGAWSYGDKSEETELITPYAKEKNMISANINYRLVKLDDGSINCRTMLEDINNAVKKIVQVCSSKGYQINKAMVWGKSAGAHLAMMYCYTYKDKSPVNIALCYNICGPANLTDSGFFKGNDIPAYSMMTIFSRLAGRDINLDNLLSAETSQALLAISPISYVNASTVPTIFNYCGEDKKVFKSNGDALEKVLKAYGVDYHYSVFPNSGHCNRSALDYSVYTAFDNKLDQMINQYVK
ncbi:MAG: alpha/beta hydrolase [Clostridia bacterium]|nr:alpha/beta hydrolase [Clostridia bacterium]